MIYVKVFVTGLRLRRKGRKGRVEREREDKWIDVKG